MKVLLLCGVFAKENEKEVMQHSRGGADLAANNFQQKLIEGFREAGCDFSVLSAPFLGAYPMGSDIAFFRGFSGPRGEWDYARFNNVWGIRNPSRAAALKKALRSFIALEEPDKRIVVYCPHTPFLEAAVYAKRRDPRIQICLYVPDLPQYMNLNAHRSRLYDLAKKYDVAVMTKLMERVDSFVLLTEPMKELLPVGDKPYRVVEGIVADWQLPARPDAPGGQEKYVVYTGKLNRKFGVRDLIDAFGQVTDPDCRLVLCGRGDCDGYAAEAAEKDRRILVLGQVPPEEARRWQRAAAVLVNPRPGGEDFVPYSFASKTIEYLLTGRPVAAYLLPGMPGCYSDFLCRIDPARPAAEGIAATIDGALKLPPEIQRSRHEKYLAYVEQNLKADRIAKMILDM
ncbi:MAG: glycosyltransferase family 4 protein [Oscillospiraceae bacterium]|nr:glycosyltransferase family 4 protein [Oscillospiraceae bacterium]